MRRIDIREWPNQSTEQIRSGETYAIEPDGEVLGYLIPTSRTDPEPNKRMLEAGIWTADADFLGCGVPTWTNETLVLDAEA